MDPCPGTCGANALCIVANHNPICSCPAGLTGDPFVHCTIIRKILKCEKSDLDFNLNVLTGEIISKPEQPRDPCRPSPCGPNSLCRSSTDNQPICTCFIDYIGNPPGCRPECVSNDDCPLNFACINKKCKDPCPGSCGINAQCAVVGHIPNCICLDGFVGNPFTSCYPKPSKKFYYDLFNLISSEHFKPKFIKTKQRLNFTNF